MRDLFWKDGRFAWPPVVALCVSLLAVVAADYVWRVSSVSGKIILAIFVVVVGCCVAGVAFDWVRNGRGAPRD